MYSAFDLLKDLVKLHKSGVDLKTLEVVTIQTEYDPRVPYDCGVDGESTVSGVETEDKILIIR